MVSYRILSFLLLILSILLPISTVSRKLTEKSDDGEVDLILEEILNEYEEFEIGKQKNVVLLLGNTGTGKSTLASLLADAELESKRISLGVFLIVDKNDKISRLSTTVSKTKVPNLMIDKGTNTLYYDCPGFGDSRGVVVDITATRSIHDLLNFASEIKFLFTVSHQAVLSGIGDRKEFGYLAEHAVTLIKDVEKYGKGMALVVTKVRKLEDFDDDGKRFVVDDATMIESVADFLKQTISDFEGKRANNTLTDDERRLNEEQIKFTKIFLERESTRYTRINILRLVEEPGLLKDMEFIQKEKAAIKNMVNYNLEYVPADSIDFGYSLSGDSKGRTEKLITKLKSQLTTQLEQICAELKSFYRSKKPMINSIVEKESDDKFFRLHSNSEYIKHFNVSVVSLDVDIDQETLKNASKTVDFFEFLQTITGEPSASDSKYIAEKMRSCSNELFNEMQHPLRTLVPNVLFDVQQAYFQRDNADPLLLNKLKTFLSVGLDKSCGLNSSVLRSLLDLSSDSSKQIDDLTRTIEFLDFLQLLNDPDEIFSIEMSTELKACAGNMQKEIEMILTNDVAEIFDLIHNFYLQEERQNYLSLEVICGTTSDIQNELSKVSTKLLDLFLKQLFDSITGLNIGPLPGNTQQFYRKNEFLQILNDEYSSIPDEITNIFSECIKYFDDSQLWYSFLLDLRVHLVTYSVQNGTLRNNGGQLMGQNIKEESSKRPANEIGLEPILESLHVNRYTDAIESMDINKFKLMAVQAVWTQSMVPFSFSCETDHLTVKGSVIAIKEVIECDCWSTAKFIDIFALIKVYIDADIDKTGMGAELSIISPQLEIIRTNTMKRQIVLEGGRGVDYTTAANNASRAAEDGDDGLPGRAGGPGGSFLVVSNTFINDQHLRVNVKGGDGGDGQRGGNGYDGIQGETAPLIAENIKIWWKPRNDLESRGFQCNQTERDTHHAMLDYVDDYTYFTCYGKAGTPPGNGGNGGCGGIGGNPGKSIIVGLDKMPKYISITKKAGAAGLNAPGGSGGLKTEKGATVHFVLHEWKRAFKKTHYELSIASKESGSIISAGDKGGRGTSCNKREDAEDVSFDPLQSISLYQAYSRENLDGNVWKLNLEDFVNGLANSKAFDTYVDVTHLIDEFNSLERQYFRLHKTIDFIQFYDSLKVRIDRFVTLERNNNSDERKTVKWLYTAVVSKLLAIKNQANQIVVSDLLSYIHTVKVNIAKLEEDDRVAYIIGYRDDYKNSLNAKMKSADELVQTMIIPVIDRTFDETEQNIQKLLDEATMKHNQTEDALIKAKENKRRLEKSLMWHNVLAPFKLVGSFLALAGPKGEIAAAAVADSASFAESVIDGGLQPQKISTPAAPYEELIAKITNGFMQQQFLFSEQLSDLVAILSETNGDGFEDIRKVVQDVAIEVNTTSTFDKYVVTDATNQVDCGRRQIQNVLDVTETHYDDLVENEKDEDKKMELTKSLSKIKKMQALLKMTDVSIDIYKQNREDGGKMDEINQQINDLEDRLNTWKQYEANIKEIMLPQLKEFESAFEKSSKELAGKSQVELDISKWKIQRALADLKKLFSEMAKAQESLLESDLIHCIEEIDEGITTMIIVYDRIDFYVEQSKLAALIWDVAIGSSDIADPTLKKAAINLDKIVQTNLVLERFESLMEALKQHKFPHARRYLEVFYKYPPGLQTNNPDEIIKTVSGNIDHLMSEIIISKSSLENLDVNSFSDQRFDHVRPFYTWYHQDFKTDIQQLLDGNEITLNANIRNGVNFTAVKFKEISINLKLTNGSLQEELNKKLERFEIVMTMVGNSYYRCNNRIYSVPLDKNVVFIFHMINGEVLGKNDIAQKLFDSDYFLSPYTVWKIQLTPKSEGLRASEDIKLFRNEQIDLQLTGVGQMIKDKVKNEFVICSNDLDNYYIFEGIY